MTPSTGSTQPDPRKTARPPQKSGAVKGLDAVTRRRIGELLVDAGLVDMNQLNEGLNIQQQRGTKIVETLITLGYLTAEAFVQFLAKQPGIASIDLSKYEIPRELISLIPREMAVKHELFPIDKLGKLLTVGMVCPLDSATVKQIESTTGLRVKPLLCAPNDIRAAIERYYPAPIAEAAEPPKPVEPAENVKGLATSLRLSNVATMIRQIDSLPALPETVRRVQDATLDPMSSIRDVADIIVMDPPIAAKVLSVANSAAYGFAQRVDEVSLAVSLLGLRETYSIVLSAAVVNVFEKTRTLDYRQFWLDAMCCAGATRIVTKAAGRKHIPGVFSGGLLHDIGRLALSEAVPDLYTKVQKDLQGADLMTAEESAIGLSHTEAGYVLADHWGLPIDIVEPIRFHHKPELATGAKEATAIVAIAEVMARTPGDNVEAWRAAIQSLEGPMRELGMDVENAEAMFQEYHNLRESCLREPMF
ncbi:MAG: HDOD domain-containing protein [Candidatus Hydrogenedentes bacterium]|nr:HDOD domain-containing protein [Candidatus Hydrogenedentota bacterium]